MSRILDVLERPYGMLLLWFAHGALYVGLLPLLAPTIAHVDANSADLMQRSFALAYQFKNPALYEWMELAVQAVIGPGPRSFLVVRYLLMGLLGLAVYALVARLSANRALGAAASLGLFTFYWFTWFFHDGISHSILVALACVVFLDAVLRYLARPGLGRACVLGLAGGFGILAKLNFLILPAGIVATLLLSPADRRRLADPRLLLALALAVAIAWVPLAATADLGRNVAVTVYAQVVDEAAHPLFGRLWAGLKIAVNFLLFLLPWLVFALWVFRSRPGEAERPPVAPFEEGFLLRLALVTAGLTLAGVTAVGARSVSERYLFPVLLALPLYVHVAWGRRVDGRRALRLFAILAAVSLAVVLSIRVFNMATATWGMGDNKRYDPHDRLAAVLVERGLGGAFFVTEDRYEAGQLLAYLPDARAAGLQTQRRRVPMSYPDEGRCILFYKGNFEAEGEPQRPPLPLPENLAALAPAGAMVETLRVPWHAALVGRPRTGLFHLVDLGTGAQACRSVFGERPR